MSAVQKSDVMESGAPMLHGLPSRSSGTIYDQALRQAVIERGFQPGTKLENQAALIISRFSVEKPEQQYKAGKYRLDFAWPAVKVALETDGWWHRSPEGAVKDRERDSWLRSQGWIVFRVDDQYGEEQLGAQLMRVSRFVRTEFGR
jgi:very-short-patch-repair endonuclease